MTLVLAWETIEGVAVVADTRFGSDHQTVAEGGPKIFAVPIVLNRPGPSLATEKCRLPAMGFAFAGNTFAGQTVNALASTCLQNLLVESAFDNGPTVAQVARLYARCSVLVVDERRKWHRTDGHLIEGLVFGRSSPGNAAQAFSVMVQIDHEAMACCEAAELDLSQGGVVALGSGREKAGEVYRTCTSASAEAGFFTPLDALRRVMDDADTTSVGGHQQFAVATRNGVELRPGLRDLALQSLNPFVALEEARVAKGIDDYQIMGYDMAAIGNVGRYSPTATHFIAV
ncbi:hypothetical protein [Sphingomonas sp.]|uniref:hypothetical protein n=1 Tax=Sphingomonas sp. TaxID=28214 RepID=UPI003AFFA76D